MPFCSIFSIIHCLGDISADPWSADDVHSVQNIDHNKHTPILSSEELALSKKVQIIF